MTKRRTLMALSRLCVVLGVVLLAAGSYFAWRHAHSQAHAPVPANPVPADPAGVIAPPSTEQPGQSDFDKYQVAPDAPRYIFIPEINVKAIVKRVGTTADNRIQAPHNIFDVGWFDQSAKPGDAGASLMAGHVSSWNSPGVFYELKTLKRGSTVIVERGDGTRLTYTVVKISYYAADNVNMETALESINPAKPGLNLITCAGSIIKGTNEFDQRMVVFAEQSDY